VDTAPNSDSERAHHLSSRLNHGHTATRSIDVKAVPKKDPVEISLVANSKEGDIRVTPMATFTKQTSEEYPRVKVRAIGMGHMQGGV
jgi:hypothetical protein